MRSTPSLKLSTRLVAFVTMIVISAVFILFVGGALSIKQLGQEYTKHSVQGIVKVIDQQLLEHVETGELRRWIPKIIKASNVIELEVSTPNSVIFNYHDTEAQFDQTRLISISNPLVLNPTYTVDVKVLPPYIGYSYSVGALWSLTLAFGLIAICLIQGVRWLREQLQGSELLEERGRMILAGRVEQYAVGDHLEWPYTASEALDKMIAELQDARQERSRFDTFIRSQTFLDQLTGAANRLSFDNKLESTLTESGAAGGVIVVQVNDWVEIRDSLTKEQKDRFIVNLGEAVANCVNRFPDVVFARYFEATFAALVPNQSPADLSNLASQVLKQVAKLEPLEGLDPENWLHAGLTVYQQGERKTDILNEVETALKSAQLEGSNNWSRFNKANTTSSERGSVRWRTLFDKQLDADKLILIKQPCFVLNESGEVDLIHQEIFSRILDEQGKILKASKFSPAIRQVGYERQLDRNVLLNIVKFLKKDAQDSCYSINFYAQPFRYRSHFNWLRDELLQLTPSQRKRLAFEFMEGPMVTYLDAMRPVLKMLSGLGCKVIVNQAGRTIISSHYLKDSAIDYLKLHRSLVRNIENRSENQLYIRSLIGACTNTKTKVIAVGVETKREWNQLVALGVDGGQGRFFAKESDFISSPTSQSKKIISTIPSRRNRWKNKVPR
ncbi:RNase E specificity factor CsrD [Vibrio breoganii]|uniref:RNase E specificity factor CsrD n=2 Tax=Vibrio TaxID=662 RepID=A0AAP8MUR7_9VIBR|nr:RNase E specificity factor CsrD [Vibrio breoganii]PMF94065.1 RNase E specificity factor CsrD [Vibrio breoganii]PMG40682.1 RNase E specificity factor CsrD [Vibrio breoganii]PMG85878.1 RNase E specificity factor CsrD [Vibrio breoganii]PMG95481.1 RNase E specificity factor CsrD [Vibrio breoganii]PMH17846.1 RNase E specificity factor CsrD [Vibrio breoganii]